MSVYIYTAITKKGLWMKTKILEWHHNTFTPSLHHVPFCQETPRGLFTFLQYCIGMLSMSKFSSTKMQLSSYSHHSILYCVFELSGCKSENCGIWSNCRIMNSVLWFVHMVGTVATGSCKNLPGKTSGQVFKTVRQTGQITTEPNLVKAWLRLNQCKRQ